MNRKIIGYKYPYETIGGRKVVDGCIKKILGNYYIDYKDKINISISQYLPKEIAESFEPIYEEIIFDSFDDIISHFKGDLVTVYRYIEIRFEDFTKDPLRVTKQNYQFTPEFEAKLKELGIAI